MKDENVQKVVLSKYEKGDGTTKIFQDLNGTINGVDESAKATLAIYPNHPIVQE